MWSRSFTVCHDLGVGEILAQETQTLTAAVRARYWPVMPGRYPYFPVSFFYACNLVSRQAYYRFCSDQNIHSANFDSSVTQSDDSAPCQSHPETRPSIPA